MIYYEVYKQERIQIREKNLMYLHVLWKLYKQKQGTCPVSPMNYLLV